jgi:hypothetical protein
MVLIEESGQMWVFIERYALPSAVCGVTVAALDCHARCEQRLREVPVNGIQPAKAADPENPIALSAFDIDIGRLEAYWYLLLRVNNVAQWRRASARCRKVRRLLAPLAGQADSGVVRVARDADLSGHPKRARAVRGAGRLAVPPLERCQAQYDQPAKIAKLLRRDADAWRSFSERSPGPDDAVIERNLLRAVVRERKRIYGLAAADPQQTRSRPADLQRSLKRVRRLIWQLELIGADGSHGLGPLLLDLRRAAGTLAEQCAVMVLADQLDTVPIRGADRRRLQKALGRTRKRLQRESRRQVDWPIDDLALSIRREVRGWGLRRSMEE